MLPDHLCNRSIPGLDEAILAIEYAQIENFTEADVIAAIIARKLLGVQFRGVWYVEAPNFCEERLTKIRSQQEPRSKGTENPQPKVLPDEVLHARILGLQGRVTFSDIKRLYRERMLEYHPDKVATLGPKLRSLAEEETKKINAAYEFFAAKYQS